MSSYYDSVVLADSPAGFWPLNESSGTTAIDLSGNGNNGTYSGSFALGGTGIGDGESLPTWSGGHISVGAAAVLALGGGNGTVECWFNASNASSGPMLYETTDTNNQVPTGPNPFLQWGTFHTIVTVGTPSNNTLYHYVITFTGGTATVYVNGASVGSNSITQPGTASTGAFTFPAGAPSGTAGKLALYSSVLTPTQIAAHYAAASGPPLPSFSFPRRLPRKLGPKAVGPTFFASQLAKLSPVSSSQITPTAAVARASVPPNATLASGASITAGTAIARARVPAGITAGVPSPAPVVTTGTAVALPSGQETLNGTANPEGGATTAFFQWGTTTAYGNQTTSQSIGSGSSAVAFNATISGLSNGVQYHYRAGATNSGGTTFGPDATFYGFNPPAPTTGLVKTWQNQNPFTYCFYDLLSGQFLGTLPLSQVTFGSQLLQPGTFSGTIDTASAAVQNLGVFDLIQPGRTALLIDYLGSFIWGGIIWTAPYDQDDTKRQLQVGATEIWSYFANQRMQATDYSAPPYSGISGTSTIMPIWDASATDTLGIYDPVLIAWQMLYDATYIVPSANLFGGTGIAANGYTTASAYLASGTNTPQGNYLAESYPYSSLQQVGSAVNQLATLGLGEGFDYAVDVGGTATGPVTCTVNLSYPRRGRLYSQSNLVLDCQRALKFTVPPDGTQTANTVYEQGANGALSVSQNAQPLNGGYPILERTMSRSSIQSTNVMGVLQQSGAADLAIYSYPLYTPTITTDLFTGPLQLGQFIVGDDVYWRIPKTDGVGNTFCPRFPQGLNVEGRIISYQAQVADAGTSTLTVTLSEPPSYTVTGPWLP